MATAYEGITDAMWANGTVAAREQWEREQAATVAPGSDDALFVDDRPVLEGLGPEWVQIANEDLTVDGERDANQQMRWKRRIAKTIADKHAQADAIIADLEQEIADTRAWAAKETAPLARLEALVDARLHDWFERWLEDHPRGRRSVELPAGEIRSRAGRVSVVVDDETAAVEWLKVNAPSLLRVPDPKPAVDKRALQDAVVATPDEGDELHAVIGEGEIVPGVHLAHSARTVDIRPHEVVR